MRMKSAALALFVVSAFCLPVQAQEGTSKAEPQATQGKESMGETVTDAWITTKVKTDLLATKDVAGSSIDVDTQAGVVTLNGTVKSQAEADKAVSVAKGIKGVSKVTSKLKVGSAGK